MIREWLLGTDQTRRYGLLLSRLVQSETWLYSMETSPRHGQERSRKQRGFWINKFCEFIVNASPKAPVNKTFTWELFFAQLLSLWPYCAASFCICAKYLSPTQLPCIADFFYVSTLDHSERAIPKFYNNCKNKTINCRNPSHHNSQQRVLFLPFPGLSPFCFISAVEYTAAGKCYSVVLSLMLSRAFPTPSITQGGHKWASFPRSRKGMILPFWNAVIFWVCLISRIMEESHVMQYIIVTHTGP